MPGGRNANNDDDCQELIIAICKAHRTSREIKQNSTKVVDTLCINMGRAYFGTALDGSINITFISFDSFEGKEKFTGKLKSDLLWLFLFTRNCRALIDPDLAKTA